MPPTDNLYKFVAISGLVLIVTAIVMYVQLLDKFEWSLAGSIAVEEAHKDYLMARLHSHTPPKHLDDSGIERWKKTQEEKIAALFDRWERLQEIHGKSGDYRVWLRIMRRWSYLLLAVGLIGVVIMVLGFYFWYYRLQKYQDRILLKQAGNNVTKPQKRNSKT